MNYSASYFELEIADDGVGFDLESVIQQTPDKESTGLLNMQKRAKLINAEVLISSQLDLGTKIKITVPKKN